MDVTTLSIAQRFTKDYVQEQIKKLPQSSANDYTKLENKPKINGVELDGDISLEALGIPKSKNTVTAFEMLFDTGTQTFPAGMVKIDTGISLNDLAEYDSFVFEALVDKDPWISRNIVIECSDAFGQRFILGYTPRPDLATYFIFDRLQNGKDIFKVTSASRGNGNLVVVPPFAGGSSASQWTSIAYVACDGSIPQLTTYGRPADITSHICFAIDGAAPTEEFNMRFAVMAITKRGE